MPVNVLMTDLPPGRKSFSASTQSQSRPSPHPASCVARCQTGPPPLAVELMRRYGDIERVRRSLNHSSAAVTVLYACADTIDEAGPGPCGWRSVVAAGPFGALPWGAITP